MKPEVAKLLCQAAHSLGMDEVQHRPNYSGRGMFGKTTDAILIPKEPVLYQLIAQACNDGTGLDIDMVHEVVSFRTDNISDDIVVY